MQGSTIVRVKRKGQVTLPSAMRRGLGIVEGSLLEAREEGGRIYLQAVEPLSAGEVVGRVEYEKVIGKLEALRRSWRRQG